MNVRELIVLLELCDPLLPVVVEYDCGYAYDDRLRVRVDDGAVVIETDSPA